MLDNSIRNQDLFLGPESIILITIQKEFHMIERLSTFVIDLILL